VISHDQNCFLLKILLFYSGRDKKKEFAPNCSAYYPFGVDVFLSPRKVDHIARFVDLPIINSTGNFPSILVVNVQVFPFFLSVHGCSNSGSPDSVVKGEWKSPCIIYLCWLHCGFYRFLCILLQFFRVKVMEKEQILFCILSFLIVTRRNFQPTFKKVSE